MPNDGRFVISSSIYRHFRIEEIRSKLFPLKWIYYDQRNEQLFINTSKTEKFITILVLVFMMSFSLFSLWDLFTKERLSIFEIYSIVMLFAIAVMLVQLSIFIAQIRKTFYETIYHLEVIDDCLAIYWECPERNYFIYYLNLFNNVLMQLVL